MKTALTCILLLLATQVFSYPAAGQQQPAGNNPLQKFAGTWEGKCQDGRTWNGPDTKPAVLYAFDAAKLGVPLYTSEPNSTRDRAGLATRFVIPVVVSGRVYFGTRSEVEVYGLLK